MRGLGSILIQSFSSTRSDKDHDQIKSKFAQVYKANDFFEETKN